MSKIINCLSVLDDDNKKFTFPFGFRWIPIIIFTVFVLQPTAWAGLSDLSVDANGDSIFNGENEKLTITFSTSNFGAEGIQYNYEITIDGRPDSLIATNKKPADGESSTIFSDIEVGKNQSVSEIWDGRLKEQKLPDGDYTVRVRLTYKNNDADLPDGQEDELTAHVTIDTKDPEISIDIGFNEFSPDLYSLPVYYSINEDVSESWLLFQRAPGDGATSQPVPLNSSSGSHTYYWDGKDQRRTFDDGKYTLKLRVIDKGGNEVASSKTEEITIDTEEPRITGITLNNTISLVNGMFTNAILQTISFSAEAGSGTPLNISGRDTDILIRPVGGQNIKGSLTYGNQPTFTLGDPLDDLIENGEYEVTVFIADRVGNLASDKVNFTFDNVPPILKRVATNSGELTPGTGLSGWTNYVEAVLEDNIQLNLTGSSIRLKDPDGNIILGQQSQHNNEKIRWELLSPLLAKDGLQDGQYTIEIVGKDKAENDTSTIQITFLFDNLAPELVSLKPSRDGAPFNFVDDTVFYNSPINQFVATFSDGEFGTGVVYSGTGENSHIVFGTANEDGEINRRFGRTFTDDTNDVLTFILDTPLIKTDGSQDGEYVINVRAVDKLGNTDTYSRRFVFDTQLPTLSSTIPAANQTVSSLSEVVIKLNDVTSGIDFIQSIFQLKRSVGENPEDVPVNIQSNGTDTATLTLLQPIALDGADDGTYIIEVTPTDLAGNTGAVIRRQFYLVSRTQPKVRLTAPETRTVSSFGDISVEIENYIGTGINFDVSTITLSNAQGIDVPQAKVEADEANNRLTWSTEAAIPRNGSADGEYTVRVVFADFSGQFYRQQFTLVLDTQFPEINTVTVGTDPPLNLSINTITDLSESFSQISIEFDGQDIDFENTVVTLTGPDATEIAVHRSDDGNTDLTLDFQNLAQLGTYTLAVTPIDRIGNVSVTPFVYRFDLDIDVPVVTAVLIGGQSGAIAYVNGSDDEIIATLTDSTGTGLALGDGASSIVVTTETGLPVPGITTSKGANQLVWRPVALPTDGSADGRYLVAITPVDKAGRTGDVVFRSFIFDTEAPRISASSPVTLHQPISYIGGSLTQFQFTVEDIGPALLDLDVQTVGLEKRDGEAISGEITHDGINQIFYTLSAPLPTHGSADGEYVLTVNLLDQAGNSYQVEHNIFYDSQAPRLSSVSLSTETPLDLIPYQVTNLSESISKLTLNFVEMTRVDFANTDAVLNGPDGSSIPLSLENNGVDQLILSFVSLTQEGLYTLSVTPQDIVGNVSQGAVPYPFLLQFEIPELSSVIANTADTSIELIQHEIIQISETINSLVLKFTDASRIDFENIQVMLTGINGQEIPITKEENTDSELVVRFVSLTESGLYLLAVTPQDKLGNTAQTAVRYQFEIDILLPAVNSVLIDGKSGSTIYVNNTDFSIVATFLEPPGVGLAFGNDGSNIVVTNANGLAIPGIAKSNGKDQIDWVTTALPSDGSADGRYTVTITPIDKIGRTGKVVNQEFIYDTQAPRITSSSPVTLHQPISYIGGSLTQFQFAIEDIGPASFDIDLQTIGLNQMDGEAVQGKITHDGTNQLFFTLSNPLPTDGSADGKYTLNVRLVDKAGNVYQTEHDILYDSQVPQISSISLNTETPLELIPHEVTNLSEVVNEVSIKFDEPNRIDFSNSVITLMGPESSDIPLTLKNNGVDQITASFVSLTQNGLYILSVSPQDIVGNASQGATQYPFRLAFEVPQIVSVKANAGTSSVSLTPFETVDISQSINSIAVVFSDPSRIDFENTNISLTGPNGQAIQVSQAGDESQFIIRFVSLTETGLYSLSITPQDIAGNSEKRTTQYSFRLAFEVPQIVSVKANVGTSSVSLTPFETVDISQSINSIAVVFSDPSRIDFENTNISLTGPNGQAIQVSQVGDESQFIIRFVSLTETGLYSLSITPQDIAGNAPQGATQYPFRLAFKAPRIISVKANVGTSSVSLTPFETVDISQSINSIAVVFSDPSRIDFENTNISLTGPNGQAIQVSQAGDESQFIIRFVSLTETGLYSLSITPQDIAGNAPQGATQYPFRLAFEAPRIVSVRANAGTSSVRLTPFKTVDISRSINGFTVVFSDPSRIDFENTSISLTDPNDETVTVSIEENNSQLSVRFVSLTQSGMYTLSVTPQDISGKSAQGAVLYPFNLKFAVPGLSSVVANTTKGSVVLTSYKTVDISESINSFTLVFTDSSRIDFENTSVSLTGENGQEIPISLEVNGTRLNVRFVSLTQSGKYTLSVTPQDIAGKSAQGAVLYPFNLKFEVPGLSSVVANTSDGSVALISYETVDISESINSFTLVFTDSSRIDFENTSVSLTGENGQEIPISLEVNGTRLNVRFVSLTQSGKYTLSVTPQDIAGKSAQGAVLYPFNLKFAVPGLSSVVANTSDGSVELISYETVDISESINSFTLVFTDSSRIDFENTIVSLTGENGQEIPISLEVNGTRLNVRFVSLTQGGMYRLSITPQDIAGNASQVSILYPFQLKFQVSAIASVKAATEKISAELIQHDVIEFSDSVNSLTLEFIDASQIDFENTNVLLTGPNGEEISITTEENEASQLVVRFVPLIQSGMYTLSVTPQDIKGNVAKNATRYQFRLIFPLPSVSSVLIDGKPGSTVYVSKSIPIVIATFSDNNGIPLSFEEDGSTIVVTNPEGMLVPGVTTSNGSDQLTWRPTPLPTDGSADGRYGVTITPVDKSGRTGKVVNQQFIYDSQAPRITSATPLTIHAPVSYIGGGLRQFVINIEDVGPAGIVLASQVAALQDSNGNSISANLTYDEIAGQLYLTLTQPFANDGSMDGIYTLNVLLIDKAGNRLNSRFNIIYDSKMPQVSSVIANTVGNPTELVQNQVTDISESISTIIVKFAEATLVDFANTTVSLLDPDDVTIPITVEDDGVSQLTLNFVGLTQIGQYTLTLIPQDVAGNAAQNPIQYSFVLEFILPGIESIVIGDTITLGSGDIAYVNADNLRIIANLLDPAETGLSFDVNTGSTILVATLDNIIVPGSTATNGTDLIVWEPSTLSTDGSSDGRYAVFVTPVDKKGRSGNTVYREFIYDTQEPEITSADPINLSQPVSYISDSLTQLSFTIQDVGPADIILDDQKVNLRNQSGDLIPTQLTYDANNQFYLTLDEPLPLDGSRDGEYTVVTAFSDKAGNILAIEHPIVYDTQAPTLVSTVPANGAQLTEDVTQIQVNLDDKGDSGIDWTLTTVTLVDPNDETISGELTSNGRTQLTLRTNQLVADGRYVIQVQAIDRAGNGSNSVFESSFLLSRRLPAVLSTSPTTAPAEEAYTNEEVDQIEVKLETADDNHLSTLRLLNADGQVVAGQQQRSSGQLVYTLIRPLATDGSEDGIYTIEFTPISASGRRGEVQQLTFTYDTQGPEIESDDITLVVTEPEVNNSLIEIQVAITDNQSGIDWENLDLDWIAFERISPNATEIEGRVSFDEQDNLIFRLTVPLADNGSADGKYRIEVTPVDQAGNGDETYEKVFTYDTSPPVIDPNSLLLNGLPLLTDITAEDYPSAISTTGGVVVQASVTDTGLGVNLSQSRIVITNPNGQEVSGNTQQNGVDTIIFKSDGLPVEGIYQVSVKGIGNDSELLGFAPKGSITTEFLYETTEPTGVVTDDGGKTELTDEPIPFQGTATDPQGVRRVPPQQGDGEIPIPASGVWLVEIVGTGPDGQPIEPVPAQDESDAQEQPWSTWTADFLPTRSGEYDLDLRVTDKAGNFAVYDIGEYTMSVSFSFSGNTFGWPNPLRHSKSDVAFFSFDLNAAAEENIELVLYIYDWGGDMVYSQTYTDIIPGERSDTHIKWNLENQSGTPVARGLYVFRLEAVNGAGNRANAVGKILVVD